MKEKKDISDFSIDELQRIAKEAGLEAREESFDAGLEIMSQDERGNLIYEKKNKRGEIVTRSVLKEDLENCFTL